jgi:hypothetical protein
MWSFFYESTSIFMRFTTTVFFLLFSCVILGQEIGIVKSGMHTIKLFKQNNAYALSYSDINSTQNNIIENTFYFGIKERVFSILMNGFEKRKNHQVIIKAPNDIIVKFQFHHFNGEYYVKILQNNLGINSFGTSTFFSKEEIKTLFGVYFTS